MTTTRLWFNRILGIVVALFLIIVIVVTALVSTQPGTRLTLQAADHFLPGELTWEGLDGHLMRDLRFDQISYRDNDTLFEANDFVLRWRPWRLLGSQVHIRQFEIGSGVVRMELDPAEVDEPDTDEFEIPDIELPFNLRLDRILLSDIALQIGPFDQHIDQLSARILTQGSRINIHRFNLQTPLGQVHADGFVNTVDDYLFDLQTVIQTEILPVGFVRVQGRSHGSLNEVHLDHELSGIANAVLTGTVFEVTNPGNLHWDTSLELRELNIEPVNEQISQLNVQFNGRGSLTDAVGSLAAEAFLYEGGEVRLQTNIGYGGDQLTFDELELELPQFAIDVGLSGSATIGEDMDIDIAGEGTFFNFEIASFRLQADGDFEGFDELSVEVETLAGDIATRGSFHWAPYLRWDMHLDVDTYDFAQLFIDWPGMLAVQAGISGSYDEELELFVNLQEVTGELRSRGIAGQGNMHLQGETLNANDFYISWGNSIVHADGTASPEELSLNWQVAIVDIGELVGDMTGSVDAQGTLVGSTQRPVLSTQLSLSDFSYQDYEVGSLEGEIAVDSQLETLPTGYLDARNVAAAGLELDTIELRMTQNRQHQTELRINSDTLQTDFILAGTWDAAATRWQGEINRLQLRYPDVGRWSLTNPAQLAVSPATLSLQNACLMIATRESELCVAAQWDQAAERLNASVQADNMSFNIFRPWMPPYLLLDGEFDIAGEFTQRGENLNYNLAVHLHQTEAGIPDQDLLVTIDAGEILRLEGSQQGLEAALNIASEQLNGRINGSATVEQLTEDPQIEGFLNTDIEDLSFVAILTPELENVAGLLQGNIDFSGPLNQPQITGGIRLTEGQADVPLTGVMLEHIEMRLDAPTAAGEPFTLQGSIQADNGELTIDGQYQLADRMAQLNVQGTAFPAMRTRDINVVIAPDIDIQYLPEGLRIRGRVDVPSARITPPDFEAVDSSSRDTVIVGGEGTVYDETRTHLPINADVQVSLGNDVWVSGYGFEGQLLGQLRIIEQPGQETAAVGNIDVAVGQYELYGQELTIERGRLVFTGGPIVNPGLDLRIERTVDLENVTVGARVGGTLRNPTLALFSTPAMQDSAVLSYLIFGRSMGEGTEGEENMLARASLALGMRGGNLLGERLSETIGVDEVMLDSTGDGLESTSLYIGKHLSSRLYVQYGIGLVEPVTTFFIRYRLTDNLNFESQTGNERRGADLYYNIER